MRKLQQLHGFCLIANYIFLFLALLGGQQIWIIDKLGKWVRTISPLCLPPLLAPPFGSHPVRSSIQNSNFFLLELSLSPKFHASLEITPSWKNLHHGTFMMAYSPWLSNQEDLRIVNTHDLHEPARQLPHVDLVMSVHMPRDPGQGHHKPGVMGLLLLYCRPWLPRSWEYGPRVFLVVFKRNSNSGV